MIFGKNPVAEALRAGKRRLLEVLVSQEFSEDDPLLRLIKSRGIAVKRVDRHQLDHLSREGVHQGILARIEKYPFGSLRGLLDKPKPKSLALILDAVTDPQNFGALARSALAFGVDAVIIPQDHSVSITGTVSKASAGAVEHLNIIQVVNLVRAMEELKKAGYWLYGASLTENVTDLAQVKPALKSAVILGSEGKGLRRLVAESCDELVKIPMAQGFDSLNVAQAGTVFLYDFSLKIKNLQA